MTTWLVTFRERTFLTKIEGDDIETSLVRETIKSEIDSCFDPTERGIEFFKTCHEGVDGHYSIEIDLLSWSELEEGYDDEDEET